MSLNFVRKGFRLASFVGKLLTREADKKKTKIFLFNLRLFFGQIRILREKLCFFKKKLNSIRPCLLWLEHLKLCKKSSKNDIYGNDFRPVNMFW